MTDNPDSTNTPADTPALTGVEDDQAAALIISNWLRDRLSGEADNERRLRRAADILDKASWWMSGPITADDVTKRSGKPAEPLDDLDRWRARGAALPLEIDQHRRARAHQPHRPGRNEIALAAPYLGGRDSASGSRDRETGRSGSPRQPK